MECPKELRQCPNGWEDCECCAHQRACIAGMYEPEEDNIEIVIKAAAVSEKVIDAEVRESIHKIRGTWAEGFLKMSEKERWEDLRKYHIPSLMDKVVLPAGEGSPGGGSKSNAKKSKKGNKKTVYVWGEFK